MKQFLKKTLLVITLLISTQYIGAQCTDNANVWNDSWTSCDLTTSPNAVRGNSHWLLYEFTEAQVIDSLHIWNANRIGESNLGVKDVIIDYSVDGDNWTEMGDYVIPQADESDDYEGVDGPALGGILVKKILFTCATNYNSDNNDCVSLAEIQFQVSELDEELGEEEFEEETLELFNIYPNPFTDLITVAGAEEQTSLKIYDITGKLLLSKIINEGSESLDLSKFSSGIYYAVTVESEKTFVIKIIKE